MKLSRNCSAREIAFPRVSKYSDVFRNVSTYRHVRFGVRVSERFNERSQSPLFIGLDPWNFANQAAGLDIVFLLAHANGATEISDNGRLTYKV